jgi:hypothetical protein
MDRQSKKKERSSLATEKELEAEEHAFGERTR